MHSKATSDLWWKNAVIYCLDVETFLDGDGDGVGDFAGLTSRIDYLAGLGVTCLWLMPFYPSPNRDDGYDISDFYGVQPALGTLGDFVEFVRTARDRGLRVIIDLVVNHTSDQHPWFQAARADRDSPFRGFYVWRDEPPADGPKDLVFPGAETSNWEYDARAGQYYLHRFYRHQPDLDITNPAVRDEIHKVIGFWLELGVSGFRVDAVPFLIETVGARREDAGDPHEYLRDLRAFTARRRGDAILLGEVNLQPEDQRAFFGDENGDELHLVFNFTLNQALYLALARGEAAPLERALRALPEIAVENEWANFARNHDELTLDKLSDAEREEVFAAFGPEERMRIFGRGIRRRVPPMLGGEGRRIRLAYSLVFALPGIPTLFYGEEIGMGENLAIAGRSAVRSPMQWSDEAHAGFAPAGVRELRRPLTGGEYGPGGVNVAGQRRDTDSLLNWMERLIRRRKECPEFGWGRWQLLETAEPAILAHRCDWGERAVVAVHNLGDRPCAPGFPLGDDERLVEVLADREYGALASDARRVEVAGYGYRWFRVRRDGQRILE